jgi:hypothetical protein
MSERKRCDDEKKDGGERKKEGESKSFPAFKQQLYPSLYLLNHIMCISLFNFEKIITKLFLFLFLLSLLLTLFYCLPTCEEHSSFFSVVLTFVPFAFSLPPSHITSSFVHTFVNSLSVFGIFFTLIHSLFFSAQKQGPCLF